MLEFSHIQAEIEERLANPARGQISFPAGGAGSEVVTVSQPGEFWREPDRTVARWRGVDELRAICVLNKREPEISLVRQDAYHNTPHLVVKPGQVERLVPAQVLEEEPARDGRSVHYEGTGKYEPATVEAIYDTRARIIHLGATFEFESLPIDAIGSRLALIQLLNPTEPNPEKRAVYAGHGLRPDLLWTKFDTSRDPARFSVQDATRIGGKDYPTECFFATNIPLTLTPDTIRQIIAETFRRFSYDEGLRL